MNISFAGQCSLRHLPWATSARSAHLGSSLRQLSFTVHPIRENIFRLVQYRTSGPGVTSLRRTPCWYLSQRVQCLRRIQANCSKDQNSAYRLDPLIWEDVTMSFAGKILDFPCLLVIPKAPGATTRSSFTRGIEQWTIIPSRWSLPL